MVGARDLEGRERGELDFAGVTRVERFSDVADAVDGAPVYVHLDCDVLDPDLFPAQFPAAGGLTDVGLRRLLDEVTQAADRVVGLEVTALEAPEDERERLRLAGLVADAVTPLLRLPV
jgi:arginase family enzyme